MTRPTPLALPLTLLAAAPLALAQSDDFNDDTLGPQWTLLQDAPAELSLSETAGRVQVSATSPASPNTDALYFSGGPAGFRLATDTDFEITLDYRWGTVDASAASVGDLLGLTFGVGRDADGTDSAALGFAVSRQTLGPVTLDATALGAAYRTDDAQSQSVLSLGGPASGTFRIAYDAAGDDLTLSVGADAFSLNDTVQAVWGADDLLVSFGARGSGFSLNAGDTWLDNFTVVSGRVVPEPSTAALACLGAAALLRRRQS